MSDGASGERSVLRTTCNRDCPDSCGVLATVAGGRVVEHRGDPAHGVTRGFLCQRGRRYLERLYSPERLLRPLRRTRSGGFQPVSWDEALDEVADRLAGAREQAGPLSVAAISYSGIRGHLTRLLGRLFWAHFGGVTSTMGGMSTEACDAAQRLDLGAPGTHAPEDLVNAKGFVVWGKNVAVTRPHALPFINRARKAGAPLHVIDPLASSTAQRADRHHQLRPGTDAWLALGLGRLLLERGAYDRAFVEEHTVGFEAYERLVRSVELERVAEITDLGLDRIEELAELYATLRPLATMIGLGPSYWQRSGVAVRLIDALAALSGNLGVPGGGAQTDLDGSAGLDLSLPAGTPRGARRRLLLPRLGEELLAARDPRVSVALVSGANPAATAPDTGRVIEGLRSLDFLVVVEQFLTATAREAHLVLPCTTYLEMDELITAYGHHWVGLCRAVVPPLGEARSDAAIYQALASRLGFGEALSGEPRAWIARILGRLVEQGLTLEALEEGARLNPLCAAVPFADRRFATASGKVELFAGDLGDLPERPRLEAGELHLVATKTSRMVNAQINEADLPPEPVVRVHPEALAARGLSAGQGLWVTSPVGRVRALVEADPAVRRDVALLNPAAWRGDLEGVNQLRVAAITDVGQAGALHETRVRLEP